LTAAPSSMPGASRREQATTNPRPPHPGAPRWSSSTNPRPRRPRRLPTCQTARWWRLRPRPHHLHPHLHLRCRWRGAAPRCPLWLPPAWTQTRGPSPPPAAAPASAGGREEGGCVWARRWERMTVLSVMGRGGGSQHAGLGLRSRCRSEHRRKSGWVATRRRGTKQPLPFSAVQDAACSSGVARGAHKGGVAGGCRRRMQWRGSGRIDARVLAR
jgi:hypothetical protein